jgi:FtsP/CotA-like multicopper oxidase with cupredoxin domain
VLLEALPATHDVAGESVRLLTYNGQFPGPEIRAAEGDRLRIQLVNRLDQPTNLHFHGLHVSPTGSADNVFIEVPPGGRRTYELVVPEGYGGTFWYHPHRHGHLARQLWHGLAGPLIVERPADRVGALGEADEQTIVVKDLTVEDGLPAPHRTGDWARGKSGRVVLVNGHLCPTLEGRAPVVRLRLVNACNARMLLLARQDGEPLTVIARDGHLLPRPMDVPELLVTPAQRVDLLVAPPPGEPVLLVHKPYNRGAAREPSSVQPLFSVRGPAQAGRPRLPDRFVPIERLEPSMATRTRRFRMAMAFLASDGHGHMDVIRPRLGEVEHWEVTNVDTQDHVFHLHTWPFQVWRRDGVAPPLPAWRDTVNLRPGERLELLIPFRDFAGKSVYHCHIAEHGDAGMMGIVEVVA